jgi:hypothetical protein
MTQTIRLHHHGTYYEIEVNTSTFVVQSVWQTSNDKTTPIHFDDLDAEIRTMITNRIITNG